MANIAVLSDIHANLPALAAVLADVDKVGCEEIWCLGDLVGYGADPNGCLDLLRERGAVSVMGNHDHAVADGGDTSDFNPAAGAAARWTRQALSRANTRYLAGLPDSRIMAGKCLLVHGAPDNRSRYLWSAWHLFAEANALRESPPLWIGLYGHTHIPRISTESRVDPVAHGHYDLLRAERYYINPGSAGQPRDDNPDAAWLRLDLDQASVEFRRVAYDVAETGRRIRSAGLPDLLATRLEVGQ